MTFEKEIAAALKFLGVSGSQIATPELVDQARRFVDLQRESQQKKQEDERYLARVSSLPGHLYTIFQKMAPPLRPVRDILEDALVEAHIPGRAIRGVHLKPWDIMIDFAFPATRLCVMVGELSEVDAGSLLLDGWLYINLQEDEIRRDAAACAVQVKKEYFDLKRNLAKQRRPQGPKEE